MQFAEGLVHHVAGHLREPEVGAGEDAENGGHTHHHVEVSDDEVGGMEIDVDRWLREEEAADAAADEHRNEAEREQRCRGDAQARTVQTAEPDQRHDGGRDGDDQGREREHQGGERIHSADEHVVSPDHVAEESDSHHAIDDDLVAEQRTAHAVDQNVGHDADCRQDRDVDLGMTEEPEQMLPQKRRSAGMRLQTIADDESGRDEETGAGDAIEDEKQTCRQQDGEGQEGDAGCDEPSPGADGHARERHAPGSEVECGGDEIQRP